MSGHGKELREKLWWRDKEEGRDRADFSQNLLQYSPVFVMGFSKSSVRHAPQGACFHNLLVPAI